MRPPRCVQPDVAAGDDRLRELDVVVLEEDDLSGDGRVAGELDDALHDVLARRVLRVGLACDDDLDGQREQPLEVGEDEPGALVRREAPCEADREPAGVERRSDERAGLELGVHVPERLVIELEDRLPAAARPAVLRGGRRRSAAARRAPGASHVPRCTPFVMWPIGGSAPGQSPAHISRATSPCSSETPFA